MGFLSSMFSKEERQAKALQKNLKKTINRLIQTEERYGAMQALIDNGSDEAIYGLLRRFTIAADSKGGMVVDEEEKAWVYKAILRFGQQALPQVVKFIHAKEGPTVNPVHSISQGLDLFLELTGRDKEAVLELMRGLISENPPGYERDPIRKEEILNFLNDWNDPRMAELIVPYLEDMSETIRFLTVETLFKFDNEEVARDAILEQLNPENNDSLRIHNRIIQGFEAAGWSIKGARSYLEPLIKDSEFSIQRGDKLVRKKGKN